MEFIELANLEEGMILSEDIINSNGIVILSEETKLTKRNIFMLENLGIRSVPIKSDAPLNSLTEEANKQFENELREDMRLREEQNKKLKLIYDDTVDSFKSIYASSKEGEKVDIKKINQLMEPVLSYTFQNHDILSTFTALNEQLGEYTYKHCINVGLFSSMIGKWMGFEEDKMKELAVAGVLHDIGKSKTPPEIINKPGRLTNEEFQIIQNHPQDGYDLIKDIPDIPEAVKLAVYQHHEKIDGSGYPNRLKRDQIHLYSKIVSVADVYDSLTSVRSYKKSICPFKVYEMLFDMSTNHLDYFIVSTFIKNLSNYFVGTYLRLTNGQKAKIVLLNKNVISRPLVINENKEYIDLSKNYDIGIEEML